MWSPAHRRLAAARDVASRQGSRRPSMEESGHSASQILHRHLAATSPAGRRRSAKVAGQNPTEHSRSGTEVRAHGGPRARGPGSARPRTPGHQQGALRTDCRETRAAAQITARCRSAAAGSKRLVLTRDQDAETLLQRSSTVVMQARYYGECVAEAAPGSFRVSDAVQGNVASPTLSPARRRNSTARHCGGEPADGCPTRHGRCSNCLQRPLREVRSLHGR